MNSTFKLDLKDDKKNVVWGALISYILIVFNALYGFILMPHIILNIGSSDFGVYRAIYSFAAALMVLDLGLGATTMRYISDFRARKQHDKINPYISMTFVQAIVMSIIVVFLSQLIYVNIEHIFRIGLNSNQIDLAKQYFRLLMFIIVLHIFENICNGIISGYNLFFVSNGIKLIRLLIRILFTYIFIEIFKNAYTLIFIDIVLIITLLIFEFLFVKIYLKIKLNFFQIDWEISKSSFRYTVLIFITSIVSQVNNNLDNVIIGALIGANIVTLYSFALLFFNVFNQLSTSISGVMLPSISKSIINDDSKLTNTLSIVIKVGRIQFLVLGTAIVGFILVGREFIDLWYNNELNYHIYYLALILMIPALFELVINTVISILRAKNMLLFRTSVLFITTILNIYISISWIKYFGFYAVAYGTAISYLIGSILIMNIYYFFSLRINIIKLYKSIFNGILPCLVVSGLITYFLRFFLLEEVPFILFSTLIFLFIFLVLILNFGLNSSEKILFNDFIKKFKFR